jgi:hypothetical protein
VGLWEGIEGASTEVCAIVVSETAIGAVVVLVF